MFNKNCIVILIISLCTFCAKQSHAQADPHSSQYYMNPLFLNPANAGIFKGNYRVSASYRNQWRSISDAFVTSTGSAEVNTNSNINFGLSILNQSAGDAGYNFLTGNLSIAYTGLRFGNDQNISLGIQTGFLNRRIDPSKFKAGDQWTAATGYSASNPTSDIFIAKAATDFDAGAGILYYDGRPDAQANVYAGVSAFHLTKPKDPFTGAADKKVLPVRYAFHGGVAITLSETVTAIPNILYMRQGNAQEKMAGAYLQLKASDDVDFLLGANYRFSDAVSAMGGLTYKQLTLGVSYDANTSDLGRLAGNANNFEITVSFTGNRKERVNMDYLKCPRL